jgi:hypothetical protein
MTEPLLSELGYLVNTDAAKQILGGTYMCPLALTIIPETFLTLLYHNIESPIFGQFYHRVISVVEFWFS